MADYSLLTDPDMTEIFESFIVETKETLEKLDLDLVKLESTPEDTDLLNEIFRSFHTVKGTSGFLGLVKMQELTHRLEDILNKLRKGEVKLNSAIMDGILSGYDALSELLVIVEENKNEEFDIEHEVKKLEKIIDQINNNSFEEQPAKEEHVQEEQLVEQIITKVKSGDSNFSDEEIEKAFLENTKSLKKKAKGKSKKNKPVEDLIENVEIITEANEKEELHFEEVINFDKSPTFQEINEINKEINAKNISESIAKKQGDEKKQSGNGVEQTIRVDVERLDELLNLVSELVLGRNRLAQLNSDVSMKYEGTEVSRNLADTARQIDLLTTELQLAVMKTRMIKIEKVFNRFPRLVRDLSKETGKDINLVISGEKTELDKTLIEEINDPLVHIIRNSVDHGIETPEVRKALGKPEKGTISLSAEHEGNHIIILIEDDGKGIDPKVIVEKAISKGILTKEKANDISKQEIYNLIFAPGFSTAEKVTNVSGRGVGMDVVKTNVSRLRGIIDIESEVNKGTRILIKLPLTLAIIQGLLVKVIGETIVLPLNSVIEVVKINKHEIYTINQTECIKLRDRVLPLINIDQILYHSDTMQNTSDHQFIVVIGLAEKRYGIKVDSLIGQKEIVIKSLGKYLGNIEGIAGSTIMGDGKVVMIADIAEIINKLKN
ncbi:MAG: chemotaxis protein CheA [Ignavibacteriae bacterium]|jgi:two-component system, chemotaxis family, sensor kinase CheA|nr:chemotaxis protein CheA [Ignavibacteriota bacterium]